MWDTFKLFFNKVWTWLKPIMMTLIKSLSADVLDIVSGVVAELAATDLTNEEKREAAFDKVKEMLKEEGKELGDSMINLLIELAVQKLKSE